MLLLESMSQQPCPGWVYDIKVAIRVSVGQSEESERTLYLQPPGGGGAAPPSRHRPFARDALQRFR